MANEFIVNGLGIATNSVSIGTESKILVLGNDGIVRYRTDLTGATGPTGSYLYSVSTTGITVSFVVPQIYNSNTSPATASLANNLTGANIGVVQKIYHNHSVAPTLPAGWVKLGAGTYATGSLNIIYAEWVSGTRVEYWIVQ